MSVARWCVAHGAIGQKMVGICMWGENVVGGFGGWLVEEKRGRVWRGCVVEFGLRRSDFYVFEVTGQEVPSERLHHQ